ncbi:MAG: class I SAM-dependent methyltransferase [Planctomycetes bacterium]|nr:class I SAM-dependent methyltransferase [Planctomycetota bacterium]
MLTELDIVISSEPIPADVRAFLHEADRRIEEFQRDARSPGFVPSDFPGAYRVLRAVAEMRMAPGSLFCEWGSGFGVIASLAAMLDFDAVGIEIDRDLVEAAQALADDYEVPVEFIHGSFLPAGCKVATSVKSGFAWLATDEAPAPTPRDLEPGDFDVIFAYPWPDEQNTTADVFQRYASPGAILVTYHGGDEFRVRRKVRKK